MRLFFAIKLPSSLIEQIREYQTKLNQEYFRLVPSDNLHITLLFLGEINDQQLNVIDNIVPEIIKQIGVAQLSIKFKKIEYGPNEYRPRLIWLTGENNEVLNNLHHLLRKSLDSFIPLKDSLNFIPHITLARFDTKNKISHLPKLPIPTIFMNRTIEINSFWLIQSKLSVQTGAQYFDIKEYHLND